MRPAPGRGSGGEGAGGGAGDGVDGVGGVGGLGDLAVGVRAGAGVAPGGEDDDAAAGAVQAGDALLAPAGSPWAYELASETMTSRRAVPGLARPRAPSRASIARQALSVLAVAVKSVTWAGASPGRVQGVDALAEQRRVAVRAEGRCPAARARIQAAEATGPVKAPMEPEMSQAIPTRSGGAGTRRLRVRVKGSAVGTAPAARWARAARALPMRSRPGGTLEVTVTVARSPAVASRSARVRRRAAAASSSRGSRVPVTARGRVLRPKTSRAARSALPRAAFSCSRLSAAPGGKGGGGGAKSAATASASISMARARALASSEGIVMIEGGGRGGVGVEAEDAAPAAGEA